MAQLRLLLFCLCLLLLCAVVIECGRRITKMRHRKKNLSLKHYNSQYATKNKTFRNKGPDIVRASHFSQTYKLGYKILLICVVNGDPLPHVEWFKDDVELKLKRNTHIFERRINEYTLKSKVEIDPAAVGDQGIYKCKANNRHGAAEKEFKTEYYY